MFTLVVQSKEVEDDDPYFLHLVTTALKLRSSGAVDAHIQKHLSRLGDRVGIALLKIFGESGLTDPKNVDNMLPIVETAFAEPRLIAMQDDKKSQVTLFLLDYLLRNVTDVQVQQRIQRTVTFVKANTSS